MAPGWQPPVDRDESHWRDRTHKPEGTWGRSTRLLREAGLLLQRDRGLQLIALWALVAYVAAMVVIWGTTFWLLRGESYKLILAVATVVGAWPLNAIGLFGNVALVAAADAALDGKRLTAREALAVARGRWRQVLAWAFVTSLVGQVLAKVGEVVPLAPQIVVWIASVAWELAAMFAVPVLALEGGSPRRVISRSASLFRARFGTTVVGSVQVTAATAVLAIPGFLALLSGAAVGGAAAVVLVGLGIAALALAFATGGVLTELFILGLYRLQTQGPDAALPFARSDLEAGVRLRGARRRWRRGS